MQKGPSAPLLSLRLRVLVWQLTLWDIATDQLTLLEVHSPLIVFGISF